MDCRIGSHAPKHHDNYANETDNVKTHRRHQHEVSEPEDKKVEDSNDDSGEAQSNDNQQVDDSPSWRKHMRFLERSEHLHHHRDTKAEHKKCEDKPSTPVKPSEDQDAPPVADSEDNLPDTQGNTPPVNGDQSSSPTEEPSKQDEPPSEENNVPDTPGGNTTPPVNNNAGSGEVGGSKEGDTSNNQKDLSIPVTLPNTKMDKAVADRMNALNPSIAAAAKAAGIPATWMQATVYAESRGNADEVSTNPDGVNQDIGLGQISYHTINDVVKPYLKTKDINVPTFTNLYDPKQNVQAFAFELRSKLELAKESMPGETDMNKLMKEASALYLGHENDDGSENVELNNSYATAVMQMKADIEAGKGLKDDYVVEYVKNGKKYVGEY